METALIIGACIAVLAIVGLVIRSSGKAEANVKAKAAELARQRGTVKCPSCGFEGISVGSTTMGATGRLQAVLVCQACGVQLT